MSKYFTKISVIGLGYVGLPLSLQFARSGLKVLGFDLILKKLTTSIPVNPTSNIFLPKALRSKLMQVVLRQRLIPLGYQRWKRFLYVSLLRWMIIANPIFPLFSKQLVPLQLTYQMVYLLLLESTTYPGPRRKNFA